MEVSYMLAGQFQNQWAIDQAGNQRKACKTGFWIEVLGIFSIRNSEPRLLRYVITCP